MPLACPCARWALLSTEQHELERRDKALLIGINPAFGILPSSLPGTPNIVHWKGEMRLGN